MLQAALIRFFDMIFSALAIVVLFPFMIPIMIALKLTGEHYIFYLQPRVGKGGKDFKVLKFATMLKDSPNLPGGVLTQKNDPRILPMGRFLRKTKINELPQLANIFIGQMSVVGPRPQARQHYELYSDAVKREIDKVPPGLSGIASIVFRDEEAILDRFETNRDHFHDTIIAPYKGELEVWWVQHRTLANYFKIIIMTVIVLFAPHSRLYHKWFRDLPTPPKELQEVL
ncbi:MAG: sugar transferase [Spirochaetota bacterium]|jgi:lipopolysaccharide/colanic/teichoic acid biosynthesis glycosyltransferase|nr:sugar transferase [Spirochaetota bacterium]